MMHQKRIAQISLILGAFQAFLQLVGYFQVQYQLVSPIIPAAVVNALVAPYLKLALISFLFAGAGSICYYKEKYPLCMIFGIMALIIPPLYVN